MYVTTFKELFEKLDIKELSDEEYEMEFGEKKPIPSSTLQKEIQEYFSNTDPKKIQEDWEKTKMFDESGIDWKIILGDEDISKFHISQCH